MYGVKTPAVPPTPRDALAGTHTHGRRVSRSVPVLEELDGALVLLGRLPGGERAEVPPLAGPGVHLPRVQPVLAGLEFANHVSAPAVRRAGVRTDPSCDS